MQNYKEKRQSLSIKDVKQLGRRKESGVKEAKRGFSGEAWKVL